jgi:hypothetical protein
MNFWKMGKTIKNLLIFIMLLILAALIQNF